MTGCDIFFFVVQDFLKLQSEEGIFRLGNSLKKEKKNVIGKEFKSMTKKALKESEVYQINCAMKHFATPRSEESRVHIGRIKILAF